MSMEVRHKSEPASITRVSLDGKERSKNFINGIPIRNGATDRMWFLSIKHTGTHFMFKHLEQMGFIQAHTNIKARTVTLVDGRLCYSHFHIEDHPGHWDMIDDVCITTIRNPMDVFRSHDKRSPLASVLEVESKVINAFDKLDEFISRYSPTLIRVDSNESIKKEICELANSIGIDYSYKKVDAATASITVTRRLMLQQPRFEIPKSVIRLAEKYKYNTLIKESQTSCIS